MRDHIMKNSQACKVPTPDKSSIILLSRSKFPPAFRTMFSVRVDMEIAQSKKEIPSIIQLKQIYI